MDTRLDQCSATLTLDNHHQLLLIFNTVVSAQELVEFANGQVADADDLNSNFQQLLDTIRLQQEAIDALDARLLALEPVDNTRSLV